MRRGLHLEASVIKRVEDIEKIIIKPCGFILSKDYPIFGASPDGITNDMIIEIKCPSKDKTIKNYVVDNTITPRYFAQLQAQMHFANKAKGLFCVADPNFETNSVVNIYTVLYDESFCANLFKKCTEFWLKGIYPAISNT